MTKTLLIAGTALAVLAPLGAGAAPVTSVYCGPASGQTCEQPNDAMVFLQGDKDVTQGFGNIGSQKGLPLMLIKSDGGALNMFVDLSNGFATITPAGPPVKATTFNGIDVTIPADATHPFGYGFTGLVFDTQLTPVAGQTTDSFTVDGFTGAHVLDLPVGTENDKADQDAEYSIRAVGGVFDEVNILATGGFDEIKHLEVSGVCAFTDATQTTCTPVQLQVPEPGSLVLLGTGVLGLGLLLRRTRKS